MERKSILSDRQEITEDLQGCLWEVMEKCVHFGIVRGNSFRAYSLPTATSSLGTRQTLDKQVKSSIDLRLVRLLLSRSGSTELFQNKDGKQED